MPLVGKTRKPEPPKKNLKPKAKADAKGKARPAKAEPDTVWLGPQSPGDRGGITFSLLSRFLVCRERFRLLVMDGWQTAPAFNHRIEYGNLWHACEEATASGKGWEQALTAEFLRLNRKYPLSGEQVEHWCNVCRVQYPLYLEHWKKHPDQVNRKPLFAERVFRVPYVIPSGRTVYLRGKWDAVYRDKATGSFFLQENKTKGDIDERQVKRQVSYDLQTMIYLVAMATDLNTIGKNWKGGILYNVVRRPLSGGVGTIRQHKPRGNKPGETRDEFYARLGDVIASDPASYFVRWNVGVTPDDLDDFRRHTLDPVLEELCNWWGFMLLCRPHAQASGDRNYYLRGNRMHWRHPFGVYNVLDEGGSHELDEYLATGSTLGLHRASDLFPELT